MAQLSPSAIKAYEEHMDVLRKLTRNLTSQPWFTSDSWFISKGIYARGIGFQLAKIHWHNHEGQGVHLETWIDGEVMARQEIALVMHVEPDLPNRKAFNESFWRLAKDKIQAWDGYEIREENLMELWRKKLPFAKSRAASLLTREFERIKDLGPEIDAAINETRPLPNP